MATITLPRFIALENGGRYLEYRAATKRVHLASNVVTSDRNFTRFEVVSAHYNNFVHIRTSYNNKFLRLEGDSGTWVAATADEPEEDRSKRSCTLFRPTYDSSNRLGLLLQAQGAEHTVILTSSILAAVRTTAIQARFSVTDLTTLVILPKHVAFKGDNGLYMSAVWRRNNYRLFFTSNVLTEKRNHHESFTLNNGNVRLRSIEFNRFWRAQNPEWVVTDSEDNSANNPDTVFRAVRLSTQGKDQVALLNMGKNKYCMRWTAGGQPQLKDTLRASSTSPTNGLAVLSVEEAIREREIYDIRYRTDQTRVYNLLPWRTLRQNVRNNSHVITIDQKVSFTYSSITQETFSSSHSWKVNYNSNIKVTVIPRIIEGEVDFNVGYEGDVKWSTMNEEREEVTSSTIATLPPRTRAVVTMFISRGSVDVPFSYRQRDVLPDGRHVVTNFDDGLFTGVNTFVFDTDVDDLEPLPENEFGEELDRDQADRGDGDGDGDGDDAPTHPRGTLSPSDEPMPTVVIRSSRL